MGDDRIQLFYVSKANGPEALKQKIATLTAEGYEVLQCQRDTDEMSQDYIEIEPGWIIITALRPKIELGTPDSRTLPRRPK